MPPSSTSPAAPSGNNSWPKERTYKQTPGNLGAIVATRDIDAKRTEIVTLSWWEDEASISAFAGSDISRARYYPEDDRFLLTRPETVQHYDSTAP